MLLMNYPIVAGVLFPAPFQLGGSKGWFHLLLLSDTSAGDSLPASSLGRIGGGKKEVKGLNKIKGKKGKKEKGGEELFFMPNKHH